MKKPSVNRRNGFALVVMAALLAIFGAFMINLIPLETTKERAQTISTQQKLNSINRALAIYWKANSALPGAADFTAATTSATFGTPQTTAACGTLGITCCAAESTSNTTVLTSCTAGTAVMIGGVPTRSLGLPDDYAFDEFGNRLTYAVDPTGGESIGVYYIARVGSASQTATAFTNASPCNVSVSRATAITSRCLISKTESATTPGTYDTHPKVSAIVVSHGKNGSAVRNRYGAAPSIACGSLTSAGNALSTTASDKENCDGDPSFILDSRGENVVGGTSSYFDDLSTYFVGGSECDRINSPCFVGMAAGQESVGPKYGALSVFRLKTSDGSLKMLHNYNSSTNKSPFYTQIFTTWGAGVNVATTIQDLKCFYVRSSGNTGCILLGGYLKTTAPQQYGGNLMAVNVSPTSGIINSGYYAFAQADSDGPTGGYTGLNVELAANGSSTAMNTGTAASWGWNRLACANVDEVNTSMVVCIAFTGGAVSGGLGNYQVFQVDFSSNLPVFTFLTDRLTTPTSGAGNLAGGQWEEASCAKVPGQSEVMCLKPGLTNSSVYYISQVAGVTTVTASAVTDATVLAETIVPNCWTTTNVGTLRGNVSCQGISGGRVMCTTSRVGTTGYCTINSLLSWDRTASTTLTRLDSALADTNWAGNSGTPRGRGSACWLSQDTVNFPDTMVCMSNTKGIHGTGGSGAPYSSFTNLQLFRYTPTNSIGGRNFDISTADMNNAAGNETIISPFKTGAVTENMGAPVCTGVVSGSRYCFVANSEGNAGDKGEFFTLWKVTEANPITSTTLTQLSLGTTTPCANGGTATCALYGSYTDLYYKWSGTLNSFTSYDKPFSIATLDPAFANGTIDFTANPTAGDTVTLNGVTYTFIAGASSGTNVQISGVQGGAINATTINNLVTALNNPSANALISVATYSNYNNTSLKIVYDTPGTGGNAYTLAESSASISTPAATLSGGQY